MALLSFIACCLAGACNLDAVVRLGGVGVCGFCGWVGRWMADVATYSSSSSPSLLLLLFTEPGVASGHMVRVDILRTNG